MTNIDIDQRRAAHDRRQKAWTFAVLGALVAWVSLGLAAGEGWVSVAGWVLFLGAVAALTYGLILFKSPRP